MIGKKRSKSSILLRLKMKKIILIGAGQIGSRHLQALSLYEHNVEVTVFDPSKEALSIARQRMLETSKGYIQAEFTTALPQSLSFDLAIIATNAHHRYEAFNLLVNSNQVTNIIFEKVLFQSKEHVGKVQNILLEKNINAWVNCPRRAMPKYKELALYFNSLIKNGGIFEMQVSGNDWGLACNSIHFIDYFCFVVNSTDFCLESTCFTPKLFSAKREGCIEAYGGISISQNKHRLGILCNKSHGVESIQVKLSCGDKFIVIDEIKGVAETNCFEKQVSKQSFILPFQSEMTHVIGASILNGEGCELASYNESADIHLAYLDMFLDFVKPYLRLDNGICPIT